jgi:hypothetical protein
MIPGVEPVTAGIPAVLATVHGDCYAGGMPCEGRDHATPWMRRILEDVSKLDLLVVEVDFNARRLQRAGRRVHRTRGRGVAARGPHDEHQADRLCV